MEVGTWLWLHLLDTAGITGLFHGTWCSAICTRWWVALTFVWFLAPSWQVMRFGGFPVIVSCGTRSWVGRDWPLLFNRHELWLRSQWQNCSLHFREVTGTLALPRICIQTPVWISGSEQVFLSVCGCSFPSLGLGNWWYSPPVSWQSLGKKWWGFWAGYDVTEDSVLILATLS